MFGNHGSHHLACLSLTMPLGTYFYPHFTDQEIDPQRISLYFPMCFKYSKNLTARQSLICVLIRNDIFQKFVFPKPTTLSFMCEHFFLLLEKIKIVYASVVLVPYLSCQKKFNNLRVCVYNCIHILCTFGQICQLLLVSVLLSINNLVVEQWCSILKELHPFQRTNIL